MDSVDVIQAAAQVVPAGGFLRCGVCKYVRPVGDIKEYEAEGWPTCCDGIVMLWVVGREERVG